MYVYAHVKCKCKVQAGLMRMWREEIPPEAKGKEGILPLIIVIRTGRVSRLTCKSFLQGDTRRTPTPAEGQITTVYGIKQGRASNGI